MVVHSSRLEDLDLSGNSISEVRGLQRLTALRSLDMGMLLSCQCLVK